MNILLITEFFPSKKIEFTGGVEARTYYIYKYLSQQHSVKVISRTRFQVTANFLSIIPRLLYQVSAFLKALFIPADIIEGSNFTSYLPAFFAAKIKGTPAVAWYADVFIDSWIKNVGLIPGIFGFLMEKISLLLPWDQIIAMSQSTKTKLINQGIRPGKITVIYGGVEYSHLRSLKSKKQSSPTICAISRLVAYKRLDDLIKAVAIVNKQLPLKLIIIGTGPQKNRLKLLAQKEGISSQVKFTGNLSHHQAMKILKSCHLFSLPSLVEGFGLVTAEAMAAGVPFVNSDISSTQEITHQGQGGLLFKPQDYQDLAKKIITFLSDKRLYAQKRRQGLHLAQNYDWVKITRQTIAVYQQALLTA